MRFTVIGGPWPERIGCAGRTVPPPNTFPPEGNTYPWAGLGKDEVVVRLDHDPLGTTFNGWTCVLQRSHLREEP